ncbi:MAG: hypothetical protein IPP06_01935 [Saprospiraceae bacterium]|nr:hypothetical protein [Candidatus Vicinibacter affinis]MBP6173077.1 hypothetical protein [Saprospiraceae bacterium]MBK6573271.1 hypothetical protein [Candidatus Vicinibacter affinis]MBK6822256.1 hypothetical protein [Candidatus Vicinibacter affinis]MBK7301954.1 hypothetical protein [Candidatus Vicinibacter affinis]
MQGWKKIMTLRDSYKAEIKKIQLIKNGIEAMLMAKSKGAIQVSLGGVDLYVKEGQYEIATILLFENEED